MSEQPVLVKQHYRGGGPGGSAPPGDGGLPPEPDGGGGGMSAKWGPLPVWGWLALAGVLAVGAYFWIRHGQSGAAAATAPTAAGTAASQAATATDTGCYDAGGNSVPCGQADYASEIAALQAEIDNMQGAASTPTSTPGAGSTLSVSVPDVVGDGAVQARAVLQAQGLTAVVQGANRGTVTAQSPSSGTVVQVGTEVTLTTSGGSTSGSTSGGGSPVMTAGSNGRPYRTLPATTQVTTT
jgi:hypothetical protein